MTGWRMAGGTGAAGSGAGGMRAGGSGAGSPSPSSGIFPITWQGEALELLPGGGVHWPARRILFVADLHLGKAAVFRRRGIPVPDGAEAHDLDRLARIRDALGLETLVILGDLVHGPGAWNPELEDRLGASLPALRILVRGNHDVHGGDPPAGLGFQVEEEGHPLGPFHLRHQPRVDDAAPPHLAGHVHPVLTLRGPGDRLRLPCFVVAANYLVLPAFGAFTGGHPWSRRPGERIFLDVRHAGEETVLPWP